MLVSALYVSVAALTLDGGSRPVRSPLEIPSINHLHLLLTLNELLFESKLDEPLTSGGGMLVSDDADLIAHARKLSTQAREPAPHYEHTEIGFNYRLSNLLAAVGRAQLEVLPDRIAARRRVNDLYRELLADVSGISFMPEASYGLGNCWLTCILVDPETAARSGLSTCAFTKFCGAWSEVRWVEAKRTTGWKGTRDSGPD